MKRHELISGLQDMAIAAIDHDIEKYELLMATVEMLLNDRVANHHLETRLINAARWNDKLTEYLAKEPK